jgi:hypothetical protein
MQYARSSTKPAVRLLCLEPLSLEATGALHAGMLDAGLWMASWHRHGLRIEDDAIRI